MKGQENKDLNKESGSTLENQKELLDYFESTRKNLQEAVENLSEAQLQYKPASDRWSVLEVLEHIVLTEQALFDMTSEVMAKEPDLEKKLEINVTDSAVIAGVENRNQKFKTSQELSPNGRYDTAEEAIADFKTQRKDILAYIEATDKEDLRNHVSESPFGSIDAYQSLIFIAAHTARHTKQIEEVLEDPGFPLE